MFLIDMNVDCCTAVSTNVTALIAFAPKLPKRSSTLEGLLILFISFHIPAHMGDFGVDTELVKPR